MTPFYENWWSHGSESLSEWKQLTRLLLGQPVCWRSSSLKWTQASNINSHVVTIKQARLDQYLLMCVTFIYENILCESNVTWNSKSRRFTCLLLQHLDLIGWWRSFSNQKWNGGSFYGLTASYKFTINLSQLFSASQNDSLAGTL